jgi:4-hydroxybenzoyl-CoA thioesterase
MYRDASGYHRPMNQPFVHDQIVRFAHCDPAGIVYFPRFFDMAHSVMEDWFANGVGYSMPFMIREHGVATPTASIRCDFSRPMRMGDTLRFELRVTQLGRSSIGLEYTGLKDGELHLKIVQTIVFVTLDTIKPVPIPEAVRPRIESFICS